MVKLLRTRSSKRRQYLRAQVDKDQEKIAEFAQTRWPRIAARVVTDKAGLRDSQRFDLLVDRLLQPGIRDFLSAHLGEPNGEHHPEEMPSFDLDDLTYELVEGGKGLLASSYSEVFREAVSSRSSQATFALAALVTHRISRYRWSSVEDEDERVLEFAGNPEYVKHLTQDPLEFTRFVKAARRKEHEVVQRKLEELSA